MELIEGSETSAYINQTPGNDPKRNLLYFNFDWPLTNTTQGFRPIIRSRKN